MDAQQWVGIILAVVGSSAFTTAVNLIVDAIKGTSKTRKATMFSLLHCVQDYGQKLIDEGSIDQEDYKQFLEMYDTYKALGGNGYAERVKKEVDNLPLK